jgi:preprotein translocase subunit SecA
MRDIHTTFTERFLRAQLVFGPPSPPPPPPISGPGPDGDGARPRKRFNALGILEDVSEEEPVAAAAVSEGEEMTMDVAPDEPPKQSVRARQDPMVVGAGRARSLSQLQGQGARGKGQGAAGAAAGAGAATDWSSVGRNDPCPCGSGKKFKKCHGANA